MNKKKFAYLLMGADFEPQQHFACFETERMVTYIYTVRSFAQAKEKMKELEQEHFGAVELCGAFGEEKARQLMDWTGHKIAVGFVDGLPEQKEQTERFFNTK